MLRVLVVQLRCAGVRGANLGVPYGRGRRRCICGFRQACPITIFCEQMHLRSLAAGGALLAVAVAPRRHRNRDNVY